MNKKRIVYIGILVTCIVIYFIFLGLILNASEPLVIDYGMRDFCYTIRGEKNGFIYWFFRIVTEFGYIYFTVGLLVLSIFLFRLDNRFFSILFGVILATSLQMAFKDIVNRERPLEEFRWMYEKSTSFPSGHSTNISIMSVFFIYIFYEAKYSKKVKIIGISSISIIWVLVLLSRMILGVHYLSDVIAGTMLGSSVGLLSIGIHILFNKYEMLNKPLIFKKKNNWLFYEEA